MIPLEPGEPDPDEESEGCLSFPGERFALRRSDRVLVTGTDLDGAPVRIEVDGWRARIMQHEFDHLDGILLVERLDDDLRKVALKTIREMVQNGTLTHENRARMREQAETSSGLTLP